MTGSQAPGHAGRKRRIVGYQGLSSRPSIQRQSAAASSKVHTGTPSAPAGRGALLLPLVPAPLGRPRYAGHPRAHFPLSFPSHLWYL